MNHMQKLQHVLFATVAFAIVAVVCIPIASGQENLTTPSYISPDFREIQRQIDAASQELTNATSQHEQTAATDKLEKALGDDYDARLAEFENHLDQVAKRLDAMRAKLKLRRDAKQDMIRLRLQVLESEAEELGWPPRLGHSRMRLDQMVPRKSRSSTRRANTQSKISERTETNGNDPSAEFLRLKNQDTSRDQALLFLDNLHKVRVRIGAELLRLESENAGSGEIEKIESRREQIIEQMTEVEEKFGIGKLSSSEVFKARLRLNRLQGEELELLTYKGRIEGNSEKKKAEQ